MARLNAILVSAGVALLYVICVFGAAPKGPLPLPSFIKACHRSDPKFNECALKSAREALPHVFDGVPKYKVPNLDPLIIDKLEVDEGHGPVGLAFQARNCTIYGIRQVRLDVVDINLKTQHVVYEFFMPRVEILCQYNATGKILLLPIQGTGPANITLNDLNLKYDYDFKKEKKDGIDYFIPDDQNAKLEYNTTRLHIKLENLFNGDKLLGDATNQALDDNWEEVIKSVGPIVTDTIAELIGTILRNIFELVPDNLAFPE